MASYPEVVAYIKSNGGGSSWKNGQLCPKMARSGNATFSVRLEIHALNR